MTIGFVNPEYATRRNIIGRCPGYQYVRCRSFSSLLVKLQRKFKRKKSGSSPYVYRGGASENWTHVDLLHFWNNIALWPCRKPYVTTFESTLPRAFPEGVLMEAGLRSLASPQCRRLIALSESARKLQMQFDAEKGIGEVVDRKITVLLPPQEVLVDTDPEPVSSQDNAVRFIFCGKDFFRKGGSEIVRALVTVRKDFPVEAHLIGDFNHVDYASSWKIDSADEMRGLFDDNSNWLHHYDRMPNAEMLELAKTCHIGLLPTRDDTFGYSVLEFQACGLPCITTDVRALPEVNNDEIGWLVKVPKKADDRADFSTPEKLRELSDTIEAGLIAKMTEALVNPGLIAAKGARALDNIRCRHSPEFFGERLGTIYKEALG